MFYYSDLTYGLAANAMNAYAVKRIYDLKGRDYNKPLSILCNHKRVFEYAVAENRQKKDVLRLVEEHWPGGVSFVITKTQSIPDHATAGLPTVCLMCPDAMTIALVDAAEFPIAATSANLAGEPPITSPASATAFRNRVDLLWLNGDSAHGESSTIIDLTSDNPVIQRHGLVPETALDWLLHRDAAPRHELGGRAADE